MVSSYLLLIIIATYEKLVFHTYTLSAIRIPYHTAGVFALMQLARVVSSDGYGSSPQRSSGLRAV